MALVEDQAGGAVPAAKTSASGGGVRSFVWEIVQTVLLTLLIFIGISLLLSVAVNVVNRRLALVER